MNFEDIDFNKLYVEQKAKTTFKAKNSDDWDKKAFSMNQRVHNSIYNEQFLKLLDLKNIDSLLDVGCGVGNLSLKLALNLSKVYSLVYSKKNVRTIKSKCK